MNRLRDAVTDLNILEIRDDIFSHLFQIDSDVDRRFHIVKIASSHIQDLLITALERATTGADIQLHRMLLRTIYTGTIQGTFPLGGI